MIYLSFLIQFLNKEGKIMYLTAVCTIEASHLQWKPACHGPGLHPSQPVSLQMTAADQKGVCGSTPHIFMTGKSYQTGSVTVLRDRKYQGDTSSIRTSTRFLKSTRSFLHTCFKMTMNLLRSSQCHTQNDITGKSGVVI